MLSEATNKVPTAKMTVKKQTSGTENNMLKTRAEGLTMLALHFAEFTRQSRSCLWNAVAVWHDTRGGAGMVDVVVGIGIRL